MCFACPTASTRPQFILIRPLGEYDVEWSAKEFIFWWPWPATQISHGMLVYKPRHGPWHAVDPNPSQAVEDLVRWLDDEIAQYGNSIIKETASMMFTTMDELNEEFQRNPQSSSGRLRLDHYLVLETTNEAAGQFLYNLELRG